MTAAQPTPATTARGFGLLRCPLCGNAEANISIDLANLTADDACKCPECGETFSLDTVRESIAAWQRVLTWIDTAPAINE